MQLPSHGLFGKHGAFDGSETEVVASVADIWTYLSAQSRQENRLSRARPLAKSKLNVPLWLSSSFWPAIHLAHLANYANFPLTNKQTRPNEFELEWATRISILIVNERPEFFDGSGFLGPLRGTGDHFS